MISYSSFIIPGKTQKQDIKGYFLEPPGEDTIIPDQNKRIPAGHYDLVDHYGERFQNVPKIQNKYVPGKRYILMHRGVKPRNTEGCLLAGFHWARNRVGTPNKDGEWKKDDKIEEIRSYVNAVKHENVKLSIFNVINNAKNK